MDIKKYRELKGISQIKLAFLTGIGRYRLYLHEKGYKKLSLEELEKVESILRQKEKKCPHK